MAKEFFTKAQVIFDEHPTRKNFLDLTGKKIDKLTVVGFYGYDDKKKQFWWCQCSCDSSKYFKVNSTSLKNNVTKSCGCNYKNNGKRGVYDKDPIDKASSALSDHLKFKIYDGWNYPCIISCEMCGNDTEFSKANNARGFQCCKDSTFDTINTNLNKLNYSYLGSGVAICNSCGIERQQITVKDYCGCKDVPDNEEPCAVYFLQEENNPWLKIGKALLPEFRKDAINNSAREVGYSFPVVSKQVWVAGEKMAYKLESILHQKFKAYKVSLPKFVGYDEVFEVNLEQCENFLQELVNKLGKFTLENYRPKFSLPEYTINQSIEWCGNWYRSRAQLLELENYTLSEYSLVENYTCKTKADARVSWRRSASIYDIEIQSEKLHGKDWGDGLFGTIHGLARRYGQCAGAIWHRVNVLNYSMKDALSMPRDNTDKYWNINGKWYNKYELSKSLGLNQATVVSRLKSNTPLKYALIPDRWVLTGIKDRIFILNGEAYWFGDLKSLIGFKPRLCVIYNKGFANLKHYLEYWDYITEDDIFEEITW